MSPRPDTDLTMVAVGTSVTWSTGNNYENKFPDLVHRDLTGDYPIEEKYLHYNTGEEPSKPRYPYDSDTEPDHPTPSYYERTIADGYSADGEGHPNGFHIPPSQYRARGGAIIGLNWPAKVEIGDVAPEPGCDELQYNDQMGYLASGPDGEYDGKLDGLGEYGTIHDSFANIFSSTDINRSKWLLMRDIGWGWPTIIDQIAQFDADGSGWEAPADVPSSSRLDPFTYSLPASPPPGEDVDLVLVDGGTNDMQLSWINDPSKAGREELLEAAELYLYDNMTGEDGLLQRARRTFPNAVIVLVGFPVWTSNRTDYDSARYFLEAQSVLGGLPSVPEQAIDNALNFSHFQSYWLRRAAAEEARADDGPGIVFAAPGWGVINAMMADWPWSFGIEVSEFYPVRSVDDTWEDRETVCEAESAWESENADDACAEEVNMVSCRAAGIGHPNNEGCRQYADTIIRRYKEYIDLSVGSVADEFDGGTASLRRSLERYGLEPAADGLRWSLSHRVVDSLTVELATRSGDGRTAPGAKQGRPSLRVYPGRSGTGERFALDTEYRDYEPGTTDQFFIDPMMRRRLTGPVGNTDRGELGATPGVNELDDQTVHPQGHWSDRRLRLGDVEHLTLLVEGIDPNDGWWVDHASCELNGVIGVSRELNADFGQSDLRDTVRPREFQLASFNRVAGVSASDVAIEATPTGFDGGLGTVAEVDVTLTVTNTTEQRVPSLLLQYGMAVNGDGRDWQVRHLGDVGPGETKTATVTLRARHDLALNGGDIELRAAAFVGDTAEWISVTTSRSDLA